MLTLRPDILHGHYLVDAAYYLPAMQGLDIPLVVSAYGYDVSSFPNRLFGGARWLYRDLWKRVDTILAMSQDMRADISRLGCPEDRVRVHYHGINIRRFPYIDRDEDLKARILFVGSLGDRRKGVDDVLRAFSIVASEHGDTELRIVGEGNLRTEYERLAVELSIADRTTFAGFVRHEDLIEEYAAAQIFCHPSRTDEHGDKEGIPGAIVEAMSTGLPVVTTRHAGIPEMATHGEHAYVVDEHDVPAIAQGLRELVANQHLRSHLGRAAAARVREKGDAERQTARLEAIYDEIVRRADDGRKR